MQKEIIKIDNLKCGGCANTVTKQLSAIVGVQSVTVDVASSTVEVEKKENIKRAILLEKLTKLGYPEMGTTNMIQKAKSYVSCAIGRLDN